LSGYARDLAVSFLLNVKTGKKISLVGAEAVWSLTLTLSAFYGFYDLCPRVVATLQRLGLN